MSSEFASARRERNPWTGDRCLQSEWTEITNAVVQWLERMAIGRNHRGNRVSVGTTDREPAAAQLLRSAAARAMLPRMRILPLAAAILAACTTGPGTTPTPATPPAAAADGSADCAAETPTAARTEEEPPVGDRCDPLPKVGAPCGGGDSYCVESWGEPGGWSSALWCRDGRWEREQERNLPEDPS